MIKNQQLQILVWVNDLYILLEEMKTNAASVEYFQKNTDRKELLYNSLLTIY